MLENILTQFLCATILNAQRTIFIRKYRPRLGYYHFFHDQTQIYRCGVVYLSVFEDLISNLCHEQLKARKVHVSHWHVIPGGKNAWNF